MVQSGVNTTQIAIALLILSSSLSGCTDAGVQDNLPGCTSPDAVNYDENATTDDNSCTFDSDGDGVLDHLEVDGCVDVFANNHDPLATDNDGSCDRITVWVGEHYFLAYTGNDTSTLYQYQVIDLQFHVTYDEWGNELPENESYILDTTNIEITWKEWPGKADGVPEPPHFIWWSPAFLNATNGTLGDITITLPGWQGQDALGEEHLTMDITNFTEGWYEGEITWWAYDLNQTMDVGFGEMPWPIEIKDRDFELSLPIVIE